MRTVQGKLTILSDNTVPGKSDMLGEHGLSIYVETDAGNYLFDTGKGKTIVHNAVVRQKDLSTIKAVILSHGHADHTGGLPDVLHYHANVPVLAHPDIFLCRYRTDVKGKKNYIGIPFHKGFLEKKGAQFKFNTDAAELAHGVHLTGFVPRITKIETGDMENRIAERNGETVQDVIADDQSLILNTRRGLLIILGCAHAGVLNIIRHSIKMTTVDQIFAIIGGTHLDFVGNSQVQKTIDTLREWSIEHLIPSHCTGPRVTARLSHEAPKNFRFSHVGFSLEF